jgi:GDPmannose 4,6-dehydratase
MKTAIITGIAGQDAAYLADLLLKKNYRVFGVAHPISDRADFWRLDYLKIYDKIEIALGDIADSDFMQKIIEKVMPDEVYNLAGQASVSKSWEDPVDTFRANALGVINVLEILHKIKPNVRFFQASSAEIFGNVSGVINEKNNHFQPLNPYGIAKLAAHLAVQNFRDQHKMFACNGILFWHISPLQSELTVTKKIAKGVAAISNGLEKEPLVFGNLAARRDLSFAGDMVRAMWLMLQQKKPDDFVICSSKTFSIKDIIKEAFVAAGIRNLEDHIKIDKNLFRPGDVRNMRGSNLKAKRILGWRPSVSMPELMKMLVEFEKSKN